jgi:hypothetical protein
MLRLIDRSKPKGAPQLVPTFLTFFVSAIWHGIYPGFFIFFIAIAMLEIQSKSFPKLKLTKALTGVSPYIPIVVGWAWNAFGMAYFGMAFVFLQSYKVHMLYLNFSYILHILMPLMTLVAVYGPKERSGNVNAEKKSQ